MTLLGRAPAPSLSAGFIRPKKRSASTGDPTPLELGRERRAASRESRRARLLPATKPPKLTADRRDQLRRLAATGEPVHELAKAFGIGRATAYRYLAQAYTPATL